MARNALYCEIGVSMTVNVKVEELKADILDLVTDENRNRVYEMLEWLEGQVHETSFNNGYDTGYEYGYDEGYRQGYSEGWLDND